MIAILTESFGGKWPFWLSPNQITIITVAPAFDNYAKSLQKQFHEAGFQADVELDTGTTLNKKVRNSQLAHYNFILVVGEKEQQHNTVNVRTRDNKVHGEVTVEEALRRFTVLATSKTNNAEDEFGTLGSASVNTKPVDGDKVAADGVENLKLNESSENKDGFDTKKYC